MVITVVWMHSWSVSIISVSILFVAVMFLLCCFCIQKKRKETLKLGVSARTNLMNISNNSLNKLMTFRSYDPNRNESNAIVPTYEKEKHGSESDLLESEDVSKRFDSSQLRIDDLDEDVKSCDSGDSRFTFYSTYPGVTRSGSNTSDTATYKSTRNSLGQVPSSSHKLYVV